MSTTVEQMAIATPTDVIASGSARGIPRFGIMCAATVTVDTRRYCDRSASSETRDILQRTHLARASVFFGRLRECQQAWQGNEGAARKDGPRHDRGECSHHHA